MNENISIVKNEGMGDTWKYVVSTNGKGIIVETEAWCGD